MAYQILITDEALCRARKIAEAERKILAALARVKPSHRFAVFEAARLLVEADQEAELCKP